jgi:hypothetical protein
MLIKCHLLETIDVNGRPFFLAAGLECERLLYITL